jgi:recombination protein RecA
LVDSENSLDDKYTVKLGADPKNILTIKFDEHGGEICYEKMQSIVETGQIHLVVIDSYNAIQPIKILQDGMDAANMGLHARMMSKLLAKVNSFCTAYGTTFIFIGQYRQGIGIMFGPTEVTQGGNALKFYSHIRMETSRSTTNDNSVFEGDNTKGDKIGNLHKVKIFKNKVGSPFRKAQYNIIYGEGIDKVEEIIRLANDYSVINKRGKTITYEETKYTLEDFTKLVKENDGFFEDLRNKILLESKVRRIDIEEEVIDLKSISEGIVNELITEENE